MVPRLGFADISSPAAVPQAIEECSQKGEEAFLGEHGYGVTRHVRLFHGDRSYPAKAILGVAHGYLYGDPRGGAREEIDYDAQLKVDGTTVGVSHEGDSNTYRWSVRGDDLTLAWQQTTYEPHMGNPEELF